MLIKWKVYDVQERGVEHALLSETSELVSVYEHCNMSYHHVQSAAHALLSGKLPNFDHTSRTFRPGPLPPGLI